MKMEVEIISKEKIKPSSPTPSHLRIFKLSLLDQLIPAPYAPIILFYDQSPDHEPAVLFKDVLDQDEDDDDVTNIMMIKKRLNLLKTSLSETLTGFYPLAGQIKDDLSIECNDEGAHYVEARVKYSTLNQFLSRPDLDLLHGFLPCDFMNTRGSRSVTNIQVNVFKCGGIAIGLCISHKILDGAALSTFLKGWASTARLRSVSDSLISSDPSSTLLLASSPSDSSSDSSILSLSSSDSDDQAPAPASHTTASIVEPNLFGATCLFPTNDDLWLRDAAMEMWGTLFIKDGKSSCVTKRFVFDAAAIATLKNNIINSSSDPLQARLQQPTRVEVVSAFIWQCAMAASKQKYGFQRPSMMSHAVNLRTRINLAYANEPPAVAAQVLDLNLENSIGNLLWIAAARCHPTTLIMPQYVHDDDDDAADHDNKKSSGSGSGRVLHGLVSEWRNALSKIDGEFVKKMRGSGDEEGKSLMLEFLKELSCSSTTGSSADNYYGFSSWCKLGFYEGGDFGWGKPTWVSSIPSITGNSVFMNFIILVDTKCGDGIEAWITLDQHHMALLHSNSHLQKLVSLDPSPLLFL